jgi:hypothetical protein
MRCMNLQIYRFNKRSFETAQTADNLHYLNKIIH